MQKRSESEISVITVSKDLTKYIIQATEKTPKKFRFTFTNTLRNLCFELLENLYLANDTFVSKELVKNRRIRITYQNKARNNVRILCFLSELALEEKAITAKQYEQISVKGEKVLKMIVSWMISDAKRFGPLDK